MKTLKALQLMDHDYLARSRDLTPEQTLRFLEEFRWLFAGNFAQTSQRFPSNLKLKR